ncbi:MAG: hydantoinase B/oxoprolinase family protein [Candidatus Thorarchaeota archaeon]|nr:hydantoinase B/oxoprolinase family protein [Candidatus Thorarchaeota archaeon]
MIDDPITFEVIKNALIAASREMSQALRRAALSPNIKERRDCSCAIFDDKGKLIAQSKDIPVHLGAMPLSVRACIDNLGEDLSPGTMALLNDPYSGGSHLPDLTLVAPVYIDETHTGFVANRAHHADVGGISPGSMPGLSLSIHEEGVVISPRIIVRNNRLVKETINDLLKATRTPREREGDLAAQIAANTVGIRRVTAVSKEHSLQKMLTTFDDLRFYSQIRMKSALAPFADRNGEFKDYMESDGAGNLQIPIVVSTSITDSGVRVSFEGTACQVDGNINCPIASTLSAVYYVFIALFGNDIPTNEGCWSIINVETPKGSLLNPNYPAAVSAGNVETSQRIVDTVIGSLAGIIPDLAPAASQGTMNNLTIGGYDSSRGKMFSFYETIGGGSGASQGVHGSNGIHTHMTNTLNTPIESLESEYPLRVRRYSLRKQSGGIGKWNGGEGLIREIELLDDDCTLSIQSERRSIVPWGLAGGLDGTLGKNLLIHEQIEYELQAKTTVKALKGSIIRIETPGGGGWGSQSDKQN